jgi:hypothetical protein
MRKESFRKQCDKFPRIKKTAYEIHKNPKIVKNIKEEPIFPSK